MDRCAAGACRIKDTVAAAAADIYEQEVVMLSHRTLAAVGALAMATMCSAATAAAASSSYVRISNGPRPDQYVLVRQPRVSSPDRPYSLTGQDGAREARRVIPTPLHLKGPRGQY